MDRTVTRLDACPAPAKLNLFLHVIGRRGDGYHLLQSAFCLINLADSLTFSLRDDGVLRRDSMLEGVPEERDLVIRAARILQSASGSRFGANISVIKRIPMGGGLGGGSSDAATTLIALNRLWNTGFDRATLSSLGLQLGADVPFFIFGHNAFVEGIGERMQRLEMEPTQYVVISPNIMVPTKDIFTAPDLTRNSEPIRIADFVIDETRNDLQAVACNLFPEIKIAVDWLGQFAPARMTGSGCCVFAKVASRAIAKEIVSSCPKDWMAWRVQSIPEHPLESWTS